MTKLFIVYTKPRHKTYYMSMNTIIQINSYFDILIYTQRSLYVKCYSSCIHNFRTTYYFIIRHLSTCRYIYFIRHVYTAFYSTHFRHIPTFISNFVELIRCSSWNITYLIRHYLTLFDIIWHNLISFFVYFCHRLSNVFDTARGKVGCRML